MAGESEQRGFSSDTPFVAVVLEQLACPVCFACLGLDGSVLLCSGCGRVYPVIDGIPVLIAEPGKSPSDSSEMT